MDPYRSMATRKTNKPLVGKRIGGMTVVYARLRDEDLAELRRREEEVGTPIAAQIRILVQNALRAGRKVIQ